MKWHGAEAREAVLKAAVGRMRLAVGEAERFAKTELGVVGQMQVVAKEEKIRLSRTQRVRLQTLEPSAPGEYPHKRTGFLQISVASEVESLSDGIHGRWGTNVPYGRWLQIGTWKMAARPWASLTNAAMLSRWRQLLGGNVGVEIGGEP